AAFALKQAQTKMYWQRAGMPIIGTLKNAWGTLTEGNYLYNIAPIRFARNKYYAQHKASAGSVAETVKAWTPQEIAVRNLAKGFVFNTGKGIKGFVNRMLGRESDPILAGLQTQIEKVLLARMPGAKALGIRPHSSFLNRVEAHYAAKKYTKVAKALLLEAKKEALQEYIATYGEAFELFYKDQNFVNIYLQKIEDSLAASSALPQEIKTTVLSQMSANFQNSSTLHVPVYNEKNNLVGTLPVERPAGMKISNNQSYYIVYSLKKEGYVGEMFFWEGAKGEKAFTTGKQVLVRSDIPLEITKNQVVRASSFGLKKAAEGLLMINNRVWPMFALYLLAGMGNVTTVIATFAKDSFTLSNTEMYLMGGVSSVVMGIISLFAGVLQNRWMFTKKDGKIVYNEKRGRLLTTNIGLVSAVIAFVLPWAGGMGGLMGEAFLYKKYLLFASFFLLGISGAFLDVSMKPTLMAVSPRGVYQDRVGSLSVFKQIVGNASNYIVPPLAMAVAMFIGTQWDWTIFFPLYTGMSIGIAGLYNIFKMKEQTLAEKEPTSPKEMLSIKKMFKELTGKEKYNKLIRRGVAAVAFHGANMSIFGMFVNNLMKDHYDAFSITQLYNADTGGGIFNMLAQTWEVMSSSWLGQSMLYFTVPIIVGRVLGTKLMKNESNFFGLMGKISGGTLLKISIALVAAGIALVNAPLWSLQVAGVVSLALGLTNISPIITGYLTDQTRKTSDAVSALMSGSSILSFTISTIFGVILDVVSGGSFLYSWAPFLIPTFLSIYLYQFGSVMNKRSLETTEEELKEILKKKEAETAVKQKNDTAETH
ncbi:MAG: MFS transporter, partial [Elusimicrobiaceae bacterium]|nr:MFS transporter [Elusimicrobiaceae bacterium]